MRRRALAHPVFAERDADARESGLAAVERAGQPQQQHRRRFGLEREVGQHVAHQRLIDEQRAERAPVARVVRGLRERLAHQRCGTGDAVEPGVVHHLDDRRDAASLVADPQRKRAVELDLARRVGTVAELVLEPLDAKRVARSVRQHARQEEARQAAGRLREDEKRVAHRGRAEPLVPGQRVRVTVERLGAGRVGAHVRTALLLGHRHPAQRAALLAQRAQAGLVGRRRQHRLEQRGEIRPAAQHRHRRIRHRDGAAVPRLDLRPHREARGARDVRAGTGLAPRRAV